MKKIIYFFFVAGILLVSNAKAGQESNNKASIHPMFKKLLVMYPREAPVVNPRIPRISPEQALVLFRNKKAEIFSVGGSAHSHKFYGIHSVPESKSWDPGVIKKINSIKNKYVLVYCA